MNTNRYENWMTYSLYAHIFGYNEKRYWRIRSIVVDSGNPTPRLLKLLWLIYLKRSEAKNAASLGTAINSGAKFASVPYMPHGIAGVFIAHGAVIGSNCCILQNVTIGSSKGRAPVIGDDCIIGAGAVIIGGVTIGNNVNIGANCTISKNVPSNTTVVSVAPRYLENRTNPSDRCF